MPLDLSVLQQKQGTEQHAGRQRRKGGAPAGAHRQRTAGQQPQQQGVDQQRPHRRGGHADPGVGRVVADGHRPDHKPAAPGGEDDLGVRAAVLHLHQKLLAGGVRVDQPVVGLQGARRFAVEGKIGDGGQIGGMVGSLVVHRDQIMAAFQFHHRGGQQPAVPLGDGRLLRFGADISVGIGLQRFVAHGIQLAGRPVQGRRRRGGLPDKPEQHQDLHGQDQPHRRAAQKGGNRRQSLLFHENSSLQPAPSGRHTLYYTFPDRGLTSAAGGWYARIDQIPDRIHQNGREAFGCTREDGRSRPGGEPAESGPLPRRCRVAGGHGGRRHRGGPA